MVGKEAPYRSKLLSRVIFIRGNTIGQRVFSSLSLIIISGRLDCIVPVLTGNSQDTDFFMFNNWLAMTFIPVSRGTDFVMFTCFPM